MCPTKKINITMSNGRLLTGAGAVCDEKTITYVGVALPNMDSNRICIPNRKETIEQGNKAPYLSNNQYAGIVTCWQSERRKPPKCWRKSRMKNNNLGLTQLQDTQLHLDYELISTCNPIGYNNLKNMSRIATT
jgi:hypothetical protein